MMPRLIVQSPCLLPLFHWPELNEINRLQQQRDELQRRIHLVPLHSDRCVELRARLKDATARQLLLQSKLVRP